MASSRCDGPAYDSSESKLSNESVRSISVLERTFSPGLRSDEYAGGISTTGRTTESV